MKKDLKCKECGTIIIDRMLSYEDDFCSEDCFEFYKNKTKDLDGVITGKIPTSPIRISTLLKEEYIKGYDAGAKNKCGRELETLKKTLLADIKGKVEKWLLENHEHHEGTVCIDCDQPYVNSLELEKFIKSILKTYV